MEYKNLVEILEDRKGEKKGITFLDGITDERFVSYETLYEKAISTLFFLQAHGLKSGDYLVFQITNNLDFLAVFWACLMGKIIPAAITPTSNPLSLLKLFNAWKLLPDPYLITFKSRLDSLETFAVERGLSDIFNGMKSRTVDFQEIKESKNKVQGVVHTPHESDPAFIQFSSGSTGEPKGVVLTHHNLVVNIAAIIKGLKSPGTDHILMATPLFARNPGLWLEKISETRSTLTVSPNFGYRYTLKHFTPAKDTNLDLSCTRLIFNGAEPISPQVCREFIDRFSPYGLKPQSMFPVYGLAEASLAVTFSEPGHEPVFDYFKRDTLSIGKPKKPEKTPTPQPSRK